MISYWRYYLIYNWTAWRRRRHIRKRDLRDENGREQETRRLIRVNAEALEIVENGGIIPSELAVCLNNPENFAAETVLIESLRRASWQLRAGTANEKTDAWDGPYCLRMLLWIQGPRFRRYLYEEVRFALDTPDNRWSRIVIGELMRKHGWILGKRYCERWKAKRDAEFKALREKREAEAKHGAYPTISSMSDS